MRLWKRKENKISGKGISHRCFGLECWPDDVWGWLRIPAMIAGIIGILGVVKYTSPRAFRLLKSFNLPSEEFCWTILAVAVTVYLLCLIYWLFPKSSMKVSTGQKNVSFPPQQWRRF